MTPYRVALYRAVVTAIFIAGQTIFITRSITGSWEESLVAAGAAGFSVLVARFGVEGAVDTARQAPPIIGGQG